MVHANQDLSNAEQSPPHRRYGNAQLPLTADIPTTVSPSKVASSPTPPSKTTSHPRIRVIYSTSSPRKYLFKCSSPRCGETFNRSYDCDRHYNGVHSLEK
ncbi:uncharacterized protein K460DRAFT_138604 [Cucurbitaria berberidis CBS 394.84]|uniref:C2H2-type domain-containing protein n=1 Tax=Cucurbitaria berberidis CBS 394.84 TaxID=1168544 RepID=A0A9P4GD65_9PLEO|nr:uncharacterized protein K460DRAFT_138604 [Cucurbitaria berberidis CBS 394.84]KAF1843040.1 hypothetical protein K460DRAFT_138604 [Cucurbitaria berberidis CBS 394.84]